MKIIDAHLHFCDWPGFDALARAAGHENTAAHLAKAYEACGIEYGIVMSNRTLEPETHNYPDFLRYCIGLDRFIFDPKAVEKQAALVEANLRRPSCVGIKLYPGYNHFYVADAIMEPFYRLAEKYDKPVAVHMGQTATNEAVLKYSHPLTLDEAAVKYPKVQFVMCHFGNPWLADAAAVIEKNPNVAADLSGLLEGKIPDMEVFFQRAHRYIDQLMGWIEYTNAYDRLMFGTDWPLANLADYISFTKHIIPQKAWEPVFFTNARRIYLGTKR